MFKRFLAFIMIITILSAGCGFAEEAVTGGGVQAEAGGEVPAAEIAEQAEPQEQKQPVVQKEQSQVGGGIFTLIFSLPSMINKTTKDARYDIF